jgi:hypothetical protein
MGSFFKTEQEANEYAEQVDGKVFRVEEVFGADSNNTLGAEYYVRTKKRRGQNKISNWMVT